MNVEQILLFVLTTSIGVIGFFLKKTIESLEAEVKCINGKISEIKIEVAKNYDYVKYVEKSMERCKYCNER
ncbi:MAG: hypothetical protein ABIN05_07400 [candidate division WOR-3 bacterium]